MTQLPVDASSRPWKPKYLTDETPVMRRWFIFGEHPNGTVDVSDGDQDIFIRLPRESAQRIIAARTELANVIEAELCRRTRLP